MTQMVLVTLSYDDSLYSYLLTQEEYEAWPDNVDPCTYMNQLKKDICSYDLSELFNYCNHHSIAISTHVSGIGY